MGYSNTTFFAYGARIPDLDPEVMKEKLRALKEGFGFSVGYLHAGDYDADMTFLVTECTTVGLGQVRTVDAHTVTPDLRATWDSRIRMAADALGTDPLHAPGWLVIPDLS